MSVKVDRRPTRPPPSPQAVKRMQRMKARKPISLREYILVRNANKVEKLKRLERRRQRAAARAPDYSNTGYKATVDAFYRAEKARAFSSPSPTQTTTTSSNISSTTIQETWLHPRLLKYKNKSSVTENNFGVYANEGSVTDNMPQLDLQHAEGDVIDLATDHSVVVHACNTLGAWGSGIALQLRRQFPAAYSIYANHCKTNYAEDLLGTCLLIAPQEKDIERTKPVWIACLFTSVGYGKGNKRNGNPGVSSKEDIVKATAPALLRMLLDWESERENEAAKEDGAEEKTPDSAIFCPKFNAGSFGVEWEKTEELIVQKWGAVEAKWAVVSR